MIVIATRVASYQVVISNKRNESDGVMEQPRRWKIFKLLELSVDVRMTLRLPQSLNAQLL